MRPDGPRPHLAGPNHGPEKPYPIRLSGPVVRGFGRGSKDLGIPTANIPPDGLSAWPGLETGVYFGVVALEPTGSRTGSSGQTVAEAKAEAEGGTIQPAVLSIGYNPFYGNEGRSVEIHIMRPLSSPGPSHSEEPQEEPRKEKEIFHKLPDFYNRRLNLMILGYIRPEYDYVSAAALVEDIRVDCEVARRSLEREAYVSFLEDRGDGDAREGERTWLRSFD